MFDKNILSARTGIVFTKHPPDSKLQIPLPIKAEIKIKSSPDLESPKSPDGKLGIEVSDDGKIAHIAQVDKVVLAVKFAKGGKGLQVLLYRRKICFFTIESSSVMLW